MSVLVLLSLILGIVLTRAQNTIEPQSQAPKLKLMKSLYDPMSIDLLFSMQSKNERIKKYAILQDDGTDPKLTSNSWFKKTGLSACSISSWRVAPIQDDKGEKYGAKSKAEIYRVPASMEAVNKAFLTNLKDSNAISSMAIAQITGDQTTVCPSHEYRCVLKIKNENDKTEKFRASDCRTAYSYISDLTKSTDYKLQIFIADSTTGLVIETPTKTPFKTIDYTKTDVLKDVAISADGKITFTKISSEMTLQAFSSKQADTLEQANLPSADLEAGTIDLSKKVALKACRKYLIIGNFKGALLMSPIYYTKKGDDLKISTDKVDVKVKAVTTEAKGLFLELATITLDEKICEFNSYEVELCKQDGSSLPNKLTFKTTTPKLILFDAEDSADLQSLGEQKLTVKIGAEKTQEMTLQQSTNKIDTKIADPKIRYSMSSLKRLVISFEMPAMPSGMEFDNYVAILKWEENQEKFKNVYISSNKGEFFDIKHNFKSNVKYSCKIMIMYKSASERDKLILGPKSAEIVYEPNNLNVYAGVVASVVSAEKINVFPVPDMDADESDKFALPGDIKIQVELFKIGLSDKFAELVQGPTEKELSSNFLVLDVKLEKGQRYFVRIQLMDKNRKLAGRYLESNLISSDVDPQISEPKDVKAELVNGDALKVSWTKPDKGEPEEYVLFLQRDFQLYEPARNITVAKDKETSFTFDNLRACSRYSVVVIPKNGVPSLPKLVGPTDPPKKFKSAAGLFMYETKKINNTQKNVRIIFDDLRTCPVVYTVELFSLTSTSQKINADSKPKSTFVTSSKSISLDLEFPGIYQARVTVKLADDEKIQSDPVTSNVLQLQAKTNKKIIHTASLTAKLQSLNKKDETFHPDMGKSGSPIFIETSNRFCGLTNIIIENADTPLAARECKVTELKEGSVIAKAQISFEQLLTNETLKFTKDKFQAVFDQGLKNMAPEDLAEQGFLIELSDSTIQTKMENNAPKKLTGVSTILLSLLAFALTRF